MSRPGLATLVSVTVALFSDFFLYGLMVPLTAASPTRIDAEWLLAIMYGGLSFGASLWATSVVLLGCLPLLSAARLAKPAPVADVTEGRSP